MNNKKSVIIPRVSLSPNADKLLVETLLQSLGARIDINVNNWSELYPDSPQSILFIAHNTTHLFAHFITKASTCRALTSTPLGPVADDNCFEIFVKHTDSPRYWNFEFNTLGIPNASSRINRSEPTRFTPSQLSQIISYGSETTPHDTCQACSPQSLTVIISLQLMALDKIETPTLLQGNFYCCAAKLDVPYFLSWNPINSQSPDFHRPDSFGYLILE